MCGIFGLFGDVSPAERVRSIGHALSFLHHRGPDDAGVLDVGDGVLVSRRLALVDLKATGHQPMQSACGRYAVTFNGEIYNHEELRDALASRYLFRGHSDTEVLLAAYSAWGDDCLQWLRGMFAFGLWDAEHHRLIVATDRFSIKPVLYWHERGKFVFASEVKAMAAIVPLELNARRVYDYLQHGLLDHSDETLFRGISQLRPGTFLTLERNALTLHRYWDIQPDDPWEPSTEAVAGLLEQSVALHMRGDVEPALSLSSGLDSRVLKAVMARQVERVECFSYCFTGTEYDECQTLLQCGPWTGGTWTGTTINADDFLDQLDSLVAVMEAPVGGLGIYGYWLNCRTVAGCGFKVLLDGQGSDEVFAGYRYYLADPDGGLRAPDGTPLESDYIHPDFAHAYAGEPPTFPAPFDDPMKNAMYRDLFYLKIPKLLRFQDRAAMSWSVEVRVPYLDHVLLESIWRVPSSTLLAGGVTKALLRQTAKERYGLDLPMPKRYVAAPQREWLKGPLKSACLDLLSQSTLADDGVVDADKLRTQYEAYAASSDLGNSFFVWKFVNLELWYRRFIRPDGVMEKSA